MPGALPHVRGLHLCRALKYPKIAQSISIEILVSSKIKYLDYILDYSTARMNDPESQAESESVSNTAYV